MTRKILFFFPIFTFIWLSFLGNITLFSPVYAACSGGTDECTGMCGGLSDPRCVLGHGADAGACVCNFNIGGGTDPNNPFGTITNPLPGGSLGPGGGLIVLLNNILRLIFVVGGIYAFIRVVLAGLQFVDAGGDAKKIEAAWSSIWQSLMGLVIIVSSLAIAALAGLLLFGDASAILNPKIYGPGNP